MKDVRRVNRGISRLHLKKEIYVVSNKTLLCGIMLKRIFDVVSSGIVLILFSPLFLLIAILIKTSDCGPVFFSHTRVGRNFIPFEVYKFRTMVIGASQKGPAITASNDLRITKVGRFLRKTKLDEIPQLFNVLKGDMSIVGPRPEVNKYVEMFLDEYKKILLVKPGITDYATIEFRDEEKILKKYNDTEAGYAKEVMPAKIELYKKYLRDKSFFTDLKLIFLTFWKIIRI